ncbi:MAG: hypothetical protein K2X47_14560, partial [Bdellovibrionales bacterium]|nr:hypothetical protein [Bdellovibrionales bacterium]
MEKMDSRSAPTKATFTLDLEKTQTHVKSTLARLSLLVRGEQLALMMNLFGPSKETKVLDVGFANDTNINLVDTNFFEKKYPFPQSVTAASVENCENIR